ncbi:hypothetical protein V6Z11_D03G080000 [Gossypium hirsutum]
MFMCFSRPLNLSSGGSYKSMGDETIWSERVVDGVTLSVSRSMADQYISHHCCWNRIFLDDGGGCQPWFNLGNETGETLRITGLCYFSRCFCSVITYLLFSSIGNKIKALYLKLVAKFLLFLCYQIAFTRRVLFGARIFIRFSSHYPSLMREN